MIVVEVVEQMVNLPAYGRHYLLVVAKQCRQVHTGHRLYDPLQGCVHFFRCAHTLERFFGCQSGELIKGVLQAFVVEQVVPENRDELLLIDKR